MKNSLSSPLKKFSTELSPLAETIEISEDYLAGGTPTDDAMSDNSHTPVSEYGKGNPHINLLTHTHLVS